MILLQSIPRAATAIFDYNLEMTPTLQSMGMLTQNLGRDGLEDFLFYHKRETAC